MSDDTPATGSCLCGAVRYRVDGGIKQVVACHCTMCRKQTSHVLAFTAAWKDDLTIEGADAISWYRSSDHSRRGFCGTCGSVLFFDTDGSEKISIGAGSLDQAPPLSLRAHLHVASKGAYYEIDDDAPRHEAGGDQVPMPPKR